MSSRPAPAAPPRLADQLCFALYSTAAAMNRVYRPLLRELGVTYPQYLVLLVLWEHDALIVSDIGARLHLDSATLTPLLKRMEKLGLVVRQRGRHDERQVVVTLTGSGRDARRAAAAILARVSCATGCTADEVTALHARLLALRASLLAA